jgi:hypothetical protein
MSADFIFSGADVVARNLVNYAEDKHRDAAIALYQEGEIELTEMKRRTPVETDALRTSGHLEEPRIGLGGFGKDIEVPIRFGGPSAGYAVIVHEDLEALHPVGQAKYVESVILESAPYLAARVAKRMNS